MTDPERLPIIGGPLDNSTYRNGVLIRRGRTRAAIGERFSKPEWTGKGEYRRTATCWLWTPPPGKANPVTGTVNRLGLVRHPTPQVMANHLDDVARRIRRDGSRVLERASELAARGLRAISTDNGSRSADPTTPTERTAGLAGEDGPLTPPDAEWIGADSELARLQRLLWSTSVQLLAHYDRILSHASTDDAVPPGTGSCQCGCGHFCDPRKDPEDRLKSKLAPSCHRRFIRWRNDYPGVTVSDYVDACYAERGETRAQPVAEARSA